MVIPTLKMNGKKEWKKRSWIGYCLDVCIDKYWFQYEPKWQLEWEPKKYPLSNSYNTSIDEKQRQVKANMSNPHSEYDEGELKRMIRAWEMKIANLQGENEWLKGELKECVEKRQK